MLQEDLSNISEWYKYILEAEDITLAGLNTILQNVERVESTYAAKIEGFSDELKEMHNDLKAFYDKIDETRPVMPINTTYLPGLTP